MTCSNDYNQELVRENRENRNRSDDCPDCHCCPHCNSWTVCSKCCSCVPRAICLNITGDYCECDPIIRLTWSPGDLGDRFDYGTAAFNCGGYYPVEVSVWLDETTCEWRIVSYTLGIDDRIPASYSYGGDCYPFPDTEYQFGQCLLQITADDSFLVLPIHQKPYRKCWHNFCGNCRCICKTICVGINREDGLLCLGQATVDLDASDDDTIVFSGSVQCSQPEIGVFSGDISILFYRDLYSEDDDCRIRVTVTGNYTEFSVDSTFDFCDDRENSVILFSEDYYGEVQISLSCANCGVCEDTVSVPCCEGIPLPRTLYATIVIPGCTCNDDDIVITMEAFIFNGIVQAWTGSGPVPGCENTHPLTITMACCGLANDPQEFRILIQLCEGDPCEFPFAICPPVEAGDCGDVDTGPTAADGVPAISQCNPIFLFWDGTIIGPMVMDPCCESAITDPPTITITA